MLTGLPSLLQVSSPGARRAAPSRASNVHDCLPLGRLRCTARSDAQGEAAPARCCPVCAHPPLTRPGLRTCSQQQALCAGCPPSHRVHPSAGASTHSSCPHSPRPRTCLSRRLSKGSLRLNSAGSKSLVGSVGPSCGAGRAAHHVKASCVSPPWTASVSPPWTATVSPPRTASVPAAPLAMPVVGCLVMWPQEVRPSAD